MLCVLVGRRQMSLQIHGVMKKAQDLDHVAVPVTPDAEHYEVTPFVVLAGDMKREESRWRCRCALVRR